MTRKLILMVATLMTISTTYAQKDESTMADEKAISEFLMGMGQAFGMRDLDGIMDSYEKQATVVFEPGQPMSDRDAIRARFEEGFSSGGKMSFGEHELFVQGDLALHIVGVTMEIEGPDGNPVEQKGLSVGILRKQENGEWKLVVDNPNGAFVMNK